MLVPVDMLVCMRWLARAEELVLVPVDVVDTAVDGENDAHDGGIQSMWGVGRRG